MEQAVVVLQQVVEKLLAQQGLVRQGPARLELLRQGPVLLSSLLLWVEWLPLVAPRPKEPLLELPLVAQKLAR